MVCWPPQLTALCLYHTFIIALSQILERKVVKKITNIVFWGSFSPHCKEKVISSSKTRCCVWHINKTIQSLRCAKGGKVGHPHSFSKGGEKNHMNWWGQNLGQQIHCYCSSVYEFSSVSKTFRQKLSINFFATLSSSFNGPQAAVQKWKKFFP